MLWYKAWLETRWRFGFLLLCSIALMALPPVIPAPQTRWWIGFEMQISLLGAFAAVYMAGSGINTQTFYAATSGFHGSMYFTLSMPVSRLRLLLTRAGVGAVETAIVISVNVAEAVYFHPPLGTTIQQIAVFGVRSIICSMAVYAVAVLLSCLLDEMWMFTASLIVVGFLYPLQFHNNWVGRLNPLRGMNLMAVPITAPMPWLTMASSVGIAAVLFWASATLVRRKEF